MGPNFELDDAQQSIVRLADEVLSDSDGTPERLWKALGQSGLLGLAVPERWGGAGLGAMAVGVLLTEIGRRAARVPAWSTLSLGVLPVARVGSPAQQRELLSGVLEGRVLTAALGAPLPVTDGWRITGSCGPVPDADAAYRVLVPVRVRGGGPTVVLIDPAAPGVTLLRTPTSAGTDEFTVRLEGAAAEPLGDAEVDLRRFAVAGACALGDGALAGALRMTAEHVRDRQQFARPLATFQAVAQQIANVYVAARTMHVAALAASWSAEMGQDADLWTAAYWLSSTALPALRTCHHLHGGLGLAADYPLHRHTALVRDLVRHLGGTEYCLHQLGAHGVHRFD